MGTHLCISLNARNASSELVSKTAPPITISSRMAKACTQLVTPSHPAVLACARALGELKMRSSSQTLSKERSSVSTNTAGGGQPDRQPATQGRTLNEVQDAQLTLGLVAEDDEVQCRKVAVDELRVLRNASARRRSRDTGRWAYLAEGGLVLYEAAQVVGCARGYALLR